MQGADRHAPGAKEPTPHVSMDPNTADINLTLCIESINAKDINT